MAIKIQEIPSGTINGVNTIFTTSQNIREIDDVWIDGAIYTGSISTVASTLTLGDAPTVSIVVDYFPTGGISFTTGNTVQDLKEVLQNLKTDISDVSDTLIFEWANHINEHAYRLLQAVDPERYISTQSYSVTSGTSSYALPSALSNIRQLGCGFFPIDNNGNQSSERLARTSFGSSDTGFYINGTNVIFTPVPTESKTITLRYIPQLSTLTSLTDTLCIPVEFMEYAKHAIDVMYSIWDEDNGAEIYADQRLQRAMEDLLKNIRKESYIASFPSDFGWY